MREARRDFLKAHPLHPHRSRLQGMALKSRYFEYVSKWSSSHILDIAPIEAFAAAILFMMSLSFCKEKEIHDPRYLKCRQKVTNPSLTITSIVSGRLSLVVSSLLYLDSCDSCFVFVTKIFLFLLLFLVERLSFRLRNHGEGKKTHSVLEAFFPFSMCISSPNFVKCW